MAYQLSDLISEVQTKGKDPSFDSSLITYYLNDTQADVLNKRFYSFMETSEAPTLSVNDTTHAYPADLQTVLEVRLTDPDSTTTYYTPQYLPHRQFFDLYPDITGYSAASPFNYTDYGRVLNWSSKLDKAYVLYLRYVKRVTPLVDSADVPQIPQEFKEILVRGALAGIEEYRDNFDIAAVHRRRIEELTEDLTMRYSLRVLSQLGRATTRGR